MKRLIAAILGVHSILLAGVALAQTPPGPPPTPVSELLIGARNGRADAQYELAMRYFRGDGVTRDTQTGLQLLRDAAAQKHAAAMRTLGEAHLSGLGVEKDTEKARQLLLDAADAGDGEAWSILGYIALGNSGGPRDPKEAERLFKESVKRGYTDGWVGVGTVLVGTKDNPGRDPAEGIAILRRAAMDGSGLGAFTLSVYYGVGNQVIKDDREASKWLYTAARRGTLPAQLMLANALRNGAFGMGKEPREAYYWASVAASRGDANAAVLKASFEQDLTPNEIADVQTQVRSWKPEITTTTKKSGLVPLKDLKIVAQFDAQQITRDNFASVVHACLPTVPDSRLEREMRDWSPPLKGQIKSLFDKDTAGAVVISESTATCVHESESGFPILATEAFVKTVDPGGVPDSVREEWFAEIARIIAAKGFAEVVYQFANGNAQIALYRPVPQSFSQIEYRTTFKKAGEYDASRYDRVFKHPELSTITSTRYGSNYLKYILRQRSLPASAAPL